MLELTTKFTPQKFEASKFIDDKLAIARRSRNEFEYSWYRNCLMNMGKQWIVYNTDYRRWENVLPPRGQQLPVTNRVAQAVNAMCGVQIQKQSILQFSPSTRDDSDIASAEKAEEIWQVCQEEMEYTRKRLQLIRWKTLCGTAFTSMWYDKSTDNGLVKTMSYSCPVHGTDTQAGPDGKCVQDGLAMSIVSAQSPKGRMRMDVLSPFEFYVDMTRHDMASQEWVIQVVSMPLDRVHQQWPQTQDDIKSGASSKESGLAYLQSLAFITNAINNQASFLSYDQGVIGELVAVSVLHRRPTREYPRGNYAVVINGKDYENMDLPYQDNYGKRTIPVVRHVMTEVPGRFYGSTPIDDIIPKQVQRNKNEAALDMGYFRMGNAYWLKPAGAGIKNLDGEPGSIIEWNPLTSNNNKPERVPGIPINQVQIERLKMIDEEIQEITWTKDILQGQNPPGVPTLGGLKLVQQGALRLFQPTFDDMDESTREEASVALGLFRQFASDERLLKIFGENNRWQLKQFTMADISGNIDIRIDTASSEFRTNDEKRAQLGNLLQVPGAINLADPLINAEVLMLMGLPELTEDMDEDIQDAVKERDEFTQTGRTRFMFFDNHKIHLFKHTEFAKSDEYKMLSPGLQAMWVAHMKMHAAALTGIDPQAPLQAPGQTSSSPASPGLEPQKVPPPQMGRSAVTPAIPSATVPQGGM